MMDAAGTEPRLRNRKAAAFLAEQVGHRDAAIFVDNLAMPAAAGMTHHGYRPNQVEARSVDRNDNLARAAMRLGVGIGHDHRDCEGRTDCVGSEPLVTIDHVVVAVPAGAG